MALVTGAAVAGTELLTTGIGEGLMGVLGNAMTFLGVNDVINEAVKGGARVVGKIEELASGKKKKEEDPSKESLENLFGDLKISDVQEKLP
jgi:hypothetical protein